VVHVADQRGKFMTANRRERSGSALGFVGHRLSRETSDTFLDSANLSEIFLRLAQAQ
jgi:hypothetical protein